MGIYLKNDYTALEFIYKLCIDSYTNQILNVTLNQNEREMKIIRYVFENRIINFESLREFLTLLIESHKTKCSSKSQEKSDKFFDCGYYNYNNSDFQNALEDFSKALMWLPTNTSDSLIRFIQIMSYQKLCLDHLNLVEQSLHVISNCLLADERLAQKYFTKNEIDKARNLAKVRIKSNHTFIYDSLKFCLKPNSLTQRWNITCISDNLIPQGTVILSERPLVSLDNLLDKTCCACDLVIHYSFWPCELCNEVVFCDQKCFKEGFEKFHKYECGLVGLLLNRSPIYLQLLSLYFKSEQINPVHFDARQNYLFQLKCFFKMPNSENISKEFKLLALNAYRQSLEQIDKVPLSYFYKPDFYSVLYAAFEFYFIYEFCNENGIINNNLMIRNDILKTVPISLADQDLPLDQFLAKYSTEPVSYYKPFNWLSNSDPVSAIFTFSQDLKRLSSSPFIQSHLPWMNVCDVGTFVSLSPVLSSALSQNYHHYNLDFKYSKKFALVELFATKDIKRGEELILKTTERIKHYKPTYVKFVSLIRNGITIDQKTLELLLQDNEDCLNN